MSVYVCVRVCVNYTTDGERFYDKNFTPKEILSRHRQTAVAHNYNNNDTADLEMCEKKMKKKKQYKNLPSFFSSRFLDVFRHYILVLLLLF